VDGALRIGADAPGEGQSTKALAAAIDRAVAEGHRDQAQRSRNCSRGRTLSSRCSLKPEQSWRRDLYKPARVVPDTNGIKTEDPPGLEISIGFLLPYAHSARHDQ
jgi:hypothetical protein